MAVYLIGAIDIEDEERYVKYIELADSTVNSNSITPLAVDDAPLVLEGNLPGKRMILMQFDTVEEMNKWYQSEGYRNARQHRLAAATTHFLVALQGGYTVEPDL
jgi:uncharacterized protein (DUF1330 family)